MSIRAALTADPLQYARFGWSERERRFYVQVVSLSLQGVEKIILWETSLLSGREVAKVLAPYTTLNAETLAALENDRRGHPQPHQPGV